MAKINDINHNSMRILISQKSEILVAHGEDPTVAFPAPDPAPAPAAVELAPLAEAFPDPEPAPAADALTFCGAPAPAINHAHDTGQ